MFVVKGCLDILMAVESFDFEKIETGSQIPLRKEPLLGITIKVTI